MAEDVIQFPTRETPHGATPIRVPAHLESPEPSPALVVPVWEGQRVARTDRPRRAKAL